MRLVYRGVDEPERSGAAVRYLLFSRSARSGTCEISRNAFYLAFRHLQWAEIIVNLRRLAVLQVYLRIHGPPVKGIQYVQMHHGQNRGSEKM